MATAPAEITAVRRRDPWRLQLDITGAADRCGLIYADEQLERALHDDASLRQVANVARLPGLVGPSLGMPDIHQGYGFPIGGVAAFDVERGVVSPGGVGYDINCGVRLMRSRLGRDELAGRLDVLAEGLAQAVPAGVGSRRADLKLDRKDLIGVLERGVGWAEQRDFTEPGDRAHIESNGCIADAAVADISDRAFERGRAQLGTLGSGNHFIEVDVVTEVHHQQAAERFGLLQGQIAVLVHTGSRGLGHQVCSDFLKRMPRAAERHGLELPDRQLACAPVDSAAGRAYLAAMAAAANYAFVNRQLISHWLRRAFAQVLEQPLEHLGLELVYDVAHNMAKLENHRVDGRPRRLCVHRKGATRAFPAGHPELPADYRAVGQPALVPGDMGRYSHVLVGTERGLDEAYGSTCHGAGRRLSRNQAKKTARGRSIAAELGRRGIRVRSAARSTLAEEMPEAYKDAADVVRVLEGAGLCRRVVKLEPLVVIKG
jgi:tRNA-splicing ligase RtcB